MGVLGLWQLLSPVGQPVTLESLESKILAVDISIWLNQAVKGYRDASGGSVANAHLLSLFSRLCKLLFYKIRPIIVFDGTAPELKKQTIIYRQQRRATLTQNSREAGLKLLANYVANQTLDKCADKNAAKKPLPSSKQPIKDDIFLLPPLTRNSDSEEDRVEDEQPEIKFTNLTKDEVEYLNQIDIESEEFRQLPTNIKQEILSTLKESRRHNSWEYYENLPTDSNEFSSYQMQCLLKRRKVQSKLEEVQRDMQRSKAYDIVSLYGDEQQMIGEPSQIMSDENAHYILFKKDVKGVKCPPNQLTVKDNKSSSVSSKEQNVQMETSDTKIISLYPKKDADPMPSTSWTLTNKAESSRKYSVHSLNGEFIDNSEFEYLDVYDKEEDSEVAVKCEVINEINYSRNYVETVNLEEELDSSVEFTQPGVFDGTTNSDSKNTSNQTNETGCLIQSKNHPGGVIYQPCSVFKDKDVSIISEVKITNSKLPNVDIKQNFPTPEDKNKSDQDKNVSIISEVKITNQNFSNIDILDIKQKFPTLQDEDKSVLETTKHNYTSEIGMSIDNRESDILKKDSNIPFPLNTETNSGTILQISQLITRNCELEIQNSQQLLKQSNNSTKNLTEDVEAEHMYISQSSSDNSITDEESFTEDILQANLAVQQELQAASTRLQAEEAKQQRQARSIQDHMYEECKELLSLFGVPYVVSATEAEAQCAFYDSEDITHGTITDDSDIWLFGGKRVYKNFFAQQKYVEFYKDKEIQSHFGLNRLKLINFAMLTGSDYTEGIEGVGRVTAMEIISEFAGEGLDALTKFKSWWNDVKKHSSPPKNKVRAKLQKLSLSDYFPNSTVFEAYLNPEIDHSKESFTWGRPDLDALRDYTREKFGWPKGKLDNALLPVLKRLSERTAQTHLDSFFTISLKKETNLFPSKRIMSALKKINSPEKGPETSVHENNSKAKRKANCSKSKAVPKKNFKKGDKGKIVKLQPPKNSAKKTLQLSEDSSTEGD